MTNEELQILLLVFSKSKVIEAMRIFHAMPGFCTSAFYKAGREEMQKRGLTVPLLPGSARNFIEKK
jgi:hypothetical protein